MTMRTQYSMVLAAAAALLTVLPLLPAAAQDAPSSADGAQAQSSKVYEDYYRSVNALQAEHTQRLAEIDRQYEEASRQFSAENSRRAQALADASTAEHKALSAKRLPVAENQKEYDRLQAADKQRRSEYAEWRDSTGSKIQDDYRTARNAEIARNKELADQLLASRNAQLARIRAGDSSIGLTPGAVAALGAAEPSGVEPTPVSGSADPDDGADGVDDSGVDDSDFYGMEALGRASDDQAGIGTADDASDSGSDDDTPDVRDGLDESAILRRADEADSAAGSGSAGWTEAAVDPDVLRRDTVVPPTGASDALASAGVTPASGTPLPANPAPPTGLPPATSLATAPEPGAERSAKDYRAPATGAGVAGADARTTGNVGAGMAAADARASGSLGAGAEVAGARAAGGGVAGSGTGGLGTDASQGATGAGGSSPQASKLASKLPEAAPAASTDSGPGATVSGGGGSGVDMPARDASGKSFEYGDGTVVSAVGPQGDVGKVNDKGDIVFVDGTSIVHTGDGEITVHRPDGSSITQRTDANGQWRTVSATKPMIEGSGSNQKYVVSTAPGRSSGGSSGSSGESEGSSGKVQSGPRGASGSSSSGSSSSSSSSNDDNDNDSSGSGGSSSGNDSDESGSADGGSSEGDSSESADDADTQGEGQEYYGENAAGSGRGGPSDVIQGIVDRATGQSTAVETGVPQPCGESGGFGVTQPGPGGAGNCIPGHLPTVSEDNDQQPETPDAGVSADAEDARRAGGSDVIGQITQPGLGQEGIPVEDLPSQSAIDRSPVVNPPPPR